jgi:hypothetical protein
LVTPFVRRVSALAVAGLLALPVAAVARDRDVPQAGPLPAGTSLSSFDSVVVKHARPAMRAASAAAAPSSRSYATPDGYRVAVEASSGYSPDPIADQKLVDFLASRVHGEELGSLSVYVGTPSEISALCGGDANTVACYAIDEARMYVPGESVHGIPVEYPLTHEYGHHVASWRLNSPWDALDWGAKNWSSAVHVCAGVRRGQLFPGNQGAHYWDDPGEGFADGYAHLHYPQTQWNYNPMMRPTPAALAAIRRDVLQPWTGPRVRTFHGRLGPHRRSRTFHIRMTLDGDLAATLSTASRGTFSVEAETPGFATGRRLRDGGGLGAEWCRQRKVDNVAVTVRRRTGRGPFSLRVSWPG